MNILELWEVAVHGVCFMLTVLRGYNKKHDIVFLILLLTLTYVSWTTSYREAIYALKVWQQVLPKCLYTIYQATRHHMPKSTIFNVESCP